MRMVNTTECLLSYKIVQDCDDVKEQNRDVLGMAQCSPSPPRILNSKI